MKASFDDLINTETPVLIDFFAEWCGPCKMQSPILKEVADEMKERVKVIKIDVDKNPEVAVKYRIQGVPTLMIFKNGNVKFRSSGMMSKSQIISTINQHQ